MENSMLDSVFVSYWHDEWVCMWAIIGAYTAFEIC